jgi:hypothetical protein
MKYLIFFVMTAAASAQLVWVDPVAETIEREASVEYTAYHGAQFDRYPVYGIALVRPGVIVPTVGLRILVAVPAGPDAVARAQEALAANETARQLAKPIPLRLAENAFFTVCEQVLTAAGEDPSGKRKLSIDELAFYIQRVKESNFAVAVELSINLLTVDASLKRYGPLWWDDAAWHPEVAP